VSGYFVKLATRALGGPPTLAPPPRLRFGDGGGGDLAPTAQPGEPTVVAETAVYAPRRAEPRRPVSPATPDRASEPRDGPSARLPPRPDPVHLSLPTQTTVEREVVVGDPPGPAGDRLERERPGPWRETVVIERLQPPAAASVPRGVEQVRPPDPVRPRREPVASVTRDERVTVVHEPEVPVGVLEPPPRPAEPTVAGRPAAVEPRRAAPVPPPVRIAIGRIELRAAIEAPAPGPPTPERARRPPPKPGLPLDQYLEQRSRK
jgi:hypothetical protein